MSDRLLQFRDGAFHESPDDAEPLLIDSFAVHDGGTVGLALHRARFAAGIAILAPLATAALPAFWAACQSRFEGWTGFPRVECVLHAGRPDLRLRLRPLGQAAESLRVLVGAPGDPRRQPRLKGPDLPQCQLWQRQAKAAGCDEYLIRDSFGTPLEGAYSGVLWWREEALCALPDDAPVLASVTRHVLLDLAQAQGVAVERYRPSLDELLVSETWFANARHGPRLVGAWDSHRTVAAKPGRLQKWSQLWRQSLR